MMTISADQAIADIGLIAARLADTAPVLAKIGNVQRIEIQDRLIHGKQGPEDERWASWAPMTRAERTKKGNVPQGLLWDTGALINSIQSQPSLASVLIGSDAPYASELQFGRAGHQAMDGRPFIGWSEHGRQEAELLMVEHIMGLGL